MEIHAGTKGFYFPHHVHLNNDETKGFCNLIKFLLFYFEMQYRPNVTINF